MSDLLRLKKEISETTDDIDGDDVLAVKKNLKNMGYYEEPEWGITKIADNQMFDGIKKFQKENKLQTDGIMKPRGETESAMNKALRYGEYATSSALQGLSFGFEDEIEGAAGAAGYGAGNLIFKGGKGFKEDVARGYRKYRDARRKNLLEGRQNAPTLSIISEITSSITAPGRFVKSAANSAPLTVKSRKNLLNSAVSGTVYGVGSSEKGRKEYVTKAVTGGTLSSGSYALGNKLWGRGGGRTLSRGLLSGGFSATGDALINRIKD